jgi:outer membrane receptor for ferrienterochelin and colicins
MKSYVLLIGLLLPFGISAQTLAGKVTNQNNEPLIGANVSWLNTTSGTITDDLGDFEISMPSASQKILITRYIGHKPDTSEIHQQTHILIKLKDINELDESVIRIRKSGVIISNIESIKTEQITQTELSKAACCDLAGCFETQTTVQPQTTNFITNSKELRILGLSGVYTQILIDGFPLIQGLTYTYGISSIPGTMVDNIFVAKGANSVLQGFESISGQINVITKKPIASEKLLINFYMNSFSEKQFNANYSYKLGNWRSITSVHSTQAANDFDKDEDGFLDLPKITRYVVNNKLTYGLENEWGWNSKIGLTYMNEQRVGGQLAFDPNKDKGSSSVYGQTVNIEQPTFWAKTGYRLNDKHNFVLFTSGFQQSQSSYFGNAKYSAQQTNTYGNFQYEFKYKDHLLKTGLSNRYMDLNEDISLGANGANRTFAGNYQKSEKITGLFAENTLKLLNKRLTFISGLRADHHNKFGMFFTPRALIKYDLSSKTVIRANIGTGWRTVNLFTENIGLLVSSRDIVFVEALEPEQAVNTGVNITRNFTVEKSSGFFSFDFYHTNFQNQVFPDYDSDPTKAFIKNFKGVSISNVFQAEAYIKIRKQVELKAGYRFLDVYREMEGVKKLLPFNARHKILGTFGYQSVSKKYHFDMNLHWYGKKRLPNTQSNPMEFQRPDFSKPYAVLNAQITYNIKKFEVYVGCENIFNIRQNRPIISWEDPFNPYFDTSSVWGPTRGRELYIGIKYKI